jgi:uncharacterized membrane protein
VIWATANAINDIGQIVGSPGATGEAGFAWVWQGGEMMALADQTGRTMEDVAAIDSRGQIIGHSGVALLWSDNTVIELPGMSFAAAINDGGQILGFLDLKVLAREDGTVEPVVPSFV